MYFTTAGHTGAGNEVTTVGHVWNWAKIWLPYITDWKFVVNCIAYNVTDYMVAK